MIQLETRSGTLFVRVFITEDDREIAVVLRRGSTDGQIVAFETLIPENARRLKTDVTRWLRRRGIDDEGRMALTKELQSVYEIFDAIRRNGPDIANGWAGSRRNRRLPEPHELNN